MKSLFYLSILLSVVCFIGINANLPAYTVSVGIDASLTGIIASVNPLVCLIFTFPFSYIIDKTGRFVVIFAGLAFYIISSFLLFIDKSIPVLFAVKVFEGLAIAAYLPASVAFITDFSKKENLSRNLGIYSSFFFFGIVLSPAISAFLGKYFGLDAIFLFIFLSSILNLLICSIVYLIYKLNNLHLEHVPVEDNLKIFSIKNFKVLLVLSIIAMAWVMGFGNSMYQSLWAYVLADKGGDIVILNLSYVFYALPIVLLASFSGIVIDKIKKYALFIVGGTYVIALTAIGYALMPYAMGVAILCLFDGIGYSFMFPALNTVLIRSGPDRYKGRLLGAFNTAVTAGTFLGTILLPYLYKVGLWVPFVTISILLILSSSVVGLALFKERFSH